ncbi:MAG TPA: nitroreductase family protein [Chloroflexota bacterium]|nr:nitroreductase family protein [Chloroflexota bacterium]
MLHEPAADRARLLDAFERVLRGRRSIRAYRPDPVPRALVEEALAAAAYAPSPHHSALWRAAVLTRPAARAALAAAMGAAWRADLAADGVPEARIAAVLARSRERLESAPVVVILCTTDERLDRYPDARRQEAERLMAAQSVGAALQNVMLAAHARGLATCWVCAPLFCPDTIVACLGLDPRLQPQALLTLGYPAAPPPARERLGLSDLVVHWD